MHNDATVLEFAAARADAVLRAIGPALSDYAAQHLRMYDRGGLMWH